ncbi:MAG: DUF2064 domain-containing protein [Bacteroidetes bacterium]|nr:DUF2064 domain-containing protein [Bacteroidota bacterium]
MAGALHHHSRRVLQDSGLPVIEISGAAQRGATFGSRLANAVADAFAAGYRQVIAVGNDCPGLQAVDWSEVVADLEAGRPVLGPTADGMGAYLIGLSRSQFDREAFAALPWQTAQLWTALEAHLHAQAVAAPVLLAARHDVNDHRDLQALLQRPVFGLAAALVAQLRHALGMPDRTGIPSTWAVVATDHAVPSGRGPPVHV